MFVGGELRQISVCPRRKPLEDVLAFLEALLHPLAAPLVQVAYPDVSPTHCGDSLEMSDVVRAFVRDRHWRTRLEVEPDGFYRQTLDVGRKERFHLRLSRAVELDGELLLGTKGRAFVPKADLGRAGSRFGALRALQLQGERKDVA